MNKYGQAEYAYGIMKIIAEKLLSNGTLNEQQLKQLNTLNKRTAFVSSAQLWQHNFSGFGDTNFHEKVILYVVKKIRLEG